MTMNKALLMAAVLAALTLPAEAAPPPEPVEARLEAVDVAGREVQADGLVWALSSTASIRMPGKARASLRDLTTGMNVRLTLVGSGNAVPVVSAITVLPD